MNNNTIAFYYKDKERSLLSQMLSINNYSVDNYELETCNYCVLDKIHKNGKFYKNCPKLDHDVYYFNEISSSDITMAGTLSVDEGIDIVKNGEKIFICIYDNQVKFELKEDFVSFLEYVSKKRLDINIGCLEFDFIEIRNIISAYKEL